MTSEIKLAPSAPHSLVKLPENNFDPSLVLQHIDLFPKILEFCKTNPFPYLNRSYLGIEKSRVKGIFNDLEVRKVSHLGLRIPELREEKEGDFREHPVRDAYLKALHITFRREITDTQWKEVRQKTPGTFTANRFALMSQVSAKNYDHALLELWQVILPKLRLENPPKRPAEIRSWMERNQERLHGLKSLDLHGKELKVIPREIRYFKGLEELYLYNNQIQVLPPDLFELINLTTLHLSNNRILEVPAHIESLRHLKYLHLVNNRISSIPVELCGLQFLYSLHLNTNKISSIPPEIGRLHNLHTLYLYSNCIEEIPDEICQLRSLSHIDLQENAIEETSETVTRFFSQVHTVQLGDM